MRRTSNFTPHLLLKMKKSDQTKLQESKEEFVPKDGGAQAWLVVICCFIINGVFYGIVDSYGVLYVDLKEHFKDIPNAATQVSLGKSSFFFKKHLRFLKNIIIL